ncbi:MAG: glycoside hydrolase family 9 protein [Candidatus Latescibacteria bacterium]|nr:glycoside hydrolase family 9 protein [Candidatus Latescibacterota bacterium]
MKVLLFDLSEAKTITKIRQKTESWSPLAKDQIIAQGMLRPIICHGGYAPDSAKRAVIWANGGKLSGTFELIDVTTNKQPPALPSVVYTGTLEEAGSHIWGGNNYVADFSDFRQEGLFWIRLKVEETDQVAESYVFRIGKSLYLDLAKKGAKWFSYQRCGCEVPGWYKACHTEDVIIRENGERVDATGGWHDAGDYGKWVGAGTTGVLALTTLEEAFADEAGDRSLVPEVIDEAAWEARYFCKVYWDGIFHQAFAPPLENVCLFLGPPDKEPPRVLTEAQCLEYSTPTIASTVLTGASLAKLGRLILPYDKSLADRCIAFAKEIQAIAAKVDPSKPEYEKEAASYLTLQTGLLLSDVALHRMGKEEKYREDAQKCVREILALQDEEGFFYEDKVRSSAQMRYHFYLVSLYEFLEQHPDSPLGPDIKDAFERWVNYMEPLAKLSNFGQVGGKAEDGSLRNMTPSANRDLGCFAWGMATAAMLFGEPKYLEIAERQIQWIVGFNPANVSMMAGVGRGPGCYHHRYCFIEGHEDGVVPGGVLNGMVGGTGEVFQIGDVRTGHFVVSDGLPVDYPVFDTDGWGWSYAHQTNEYWTINNAWFIMGAVQVEKAMRKLKNR